ncbi:MAG: outer membrane beta-barrel protein [Planctomycetes bacterium]|nr:outer membrane beta-barrel protein [Planctomycetota bacterium]
MFNLHNYRKSIYRGLAASVLASLLLVSGTATADSGFYVGGSVGNTTLQTEITDPVGGGNFTFDESDFSWKAFGGYNFDLPVIDLGIEGGYRSLGGPSATIASESYGIDITAWDVFGVAGFDLGPLTVFGKLGIISWDADLTVSGLDAGSEDDQDTAYGVGASFNLGSLQLRAEYEMFDVSDVEDLYMLSAGFVYTF